MRNITDAANACKKGTQQITVATRLRHDGQLGGHVRVRAAAEVADDVLRAEHAVGLESGFRFNIGFGVGDKSTRICSTTDQIGIIKMLRRQAFRGK